MPTYSRPKNDLARLVFLKRAATTGAQDLKSGDACVSQETVDAINAFLPDFEAAVNTISEKLGDRVQEVQERGAAIERVALTSATFGRCSNAAPSGSINRQRY